MHLFVAPQCKVQQCSNISISSVNSSSANCAADVDCGGNIIWTVIKLWLSSFYYLELPLLPQRCGCCKLLSLLLLLLLLSHCCCCQLLQHFICIWFFFSIAPALLPLPVLLLVFCFVFSNTWVYRSARCKLLSLLLQAAVVALAFVLYCNKSKKCCMLTVFVLWVCVCVFYFFCLEPLHMSAPLWCVVIDVLYYGQLHFVICICQHKRRTCNGLQPLPSPPCRSMCEPHSWPTSIAGEMMANEQLNS